MSVLTCYVSWTTRSHLYQWKICHVIQRTIWGSDSSPCMTCTCVRVTNYFAPLSSRLDATAWTCKRGAFPAHTLCFGACSRLRSALPVYSFGDAASRLCICSHSGSTHIRPSTQRGGSDLKLLFACHNNLLLGEENSRVSLLAWIARGQNGYSQGVEPDANAVVELLYYPNKLDSMFAILLDP